MIYLAAQRILDAGGRLCAVEVLARWRQTREAPAVGLASLLADPLDRRWAAVDQLVLCRLLSGLPRLAVPLHINASPWCLLDPVWFRRWAVLLRRVRAGNPAGIVVEVPETLDAAPEQIDGMIARLHSLGCRVALDDLGEHRATFARLARHPWDLCKLDWRPGSCLRHGSLPDAVAAGHARGAMVCVEGVETAEDIREAVAAGAGLLQGYAIHRPAPLADAVFDQQLAIIAR